MVNELSMFEPPKFYCMIKLSFKPSYGFSDWFETSVVADAYEKLNQTRNHFFGYYTNPAEAPQHYLLTGFFLCKIQSKLENVFVKHFAPNHMPDPKVEWSLLENINGNNSELQQSIYLPSPVRGQRFKSLIQILFKVSNAEFC